MSEFVSALFDTRERCDHAVELLTREGFDFSDIEFTQGAPAGPPVDTSAPGVPSEDPLPSEPPRPGPAPDVPTDGVDDPAAGSSTGTALGAVSAAFGVGPTASPQTDERLRDGGFIVGVRAAGDRRNVALEVLTRAGGESFDVR